MGALDPRQSAERWRRRTAIALVAVAMATIAIGSPARAADDRSLRVWLETRRVGVPRTLCVGDTVRFRTTVWQGTGTIAGMARIGGADVSAVVVGSAGTVSPGSVQTSLRGSPPFAATFAYTAREAGTDVLEITATVDPTRFLGLTMGGTVLANRLQVTVVDCNYRITLTSRWRVKGEAKLAIVAHIEFAGIRIEDEGITEATAAVTWTVSAGVVGDCRGTLPVESRATVSVAHSVRDQIILDVEFDAAIAQISIDCGGASGTMPVPVQAEPVTVLVPVGGGTKSVRQMLTEPGSARGTAVLVLVTEVAR